MPRKPRTRDDNGVFAKPEPRKAKHYRHGVHGPGKCEKCPVCQHEHCAVIEESYLDYRRSKDIAALFGGFTEGELDWHCESLGLHNKRTANTDAVARVIVEEGVRAIQDGVVEVKPELVMRAAQHRDEKEGRMPPRKLEGGGERTLVIVAGKASAGLLPEMAPPIQVEATVVEPDGEAD